MLTIPFKTPADYSESLNKIGMLAFVWNLIIILTYSFFVMDIGEFTFKNLGIPKPAKGISFYGVHLPIVEVLLAFVIALIARIIRLHDVIGKLLGIRDTYLYKNIILPIAAQSTVGVSIEKLRSDSNLSRRVFYKHLKDVDTHYVRMFWDRISWFWSSIEGIFYLALFSVLAAVQDSYLVAFWLMAAAVAVVLLSFALKASAEKATQDEVREILTDPVRANDIDTELAKL